MKGTEQTWLGMIIGICFCMPCFASEMKLYERFSLIPYQSQRSFDLDASSYAGIVQNESGIKRLSGRVAMEFRRQRLRESSFDFNGLDRTKQESMDIKMLVRDYEKGLWVTQYSLAYVGQDVEFLNHSLKGDRHAHRLDRLSQSWKRIFSDDLFVELSAGIANCKDQYEGDQQRFLTYHVAVSKNFSKAKIALQWSQDILGGGAQTGIYGIQKVQQAKLQSEIALGERVSLLLNCMLSKVDSTFSEGEEMISESTVLSSSAKIAYQMNQNLSASIGYTHRRFLEDAKDFGHGGEGSMMGASLSYSIF